MPLTAGIHLGPYEILEPIGAGGMGEVYKARDTRLDRVVALKVLPSDKVENPERKQRFVQEAKAASALNHPNIITLHDISSDQGIDFIVMEFVAGKSLSQLIPGKGLRLNDVLKYSIQIADALAKAHAAGIVHRDLKPGNIMVSDDGLVKVLDFGLAKLVNVPNTGEDGTTRTIAAETEEGTILGTIAYMSPEQAEGKRVDARSDIFSFGAVLYEMITGQRAFQGDTKMSTLAAILHKEPVPVGHIIADVPQDLEKIITRCLRKELDRRAQHIGDIKLALEELRDDSASGKLSATSKIPEQTPARKSLPLAAAVSGAAVLVAAAAGAFWWLKRTPVAPPARTEWTQITNFADSVSQPALSADGRMLTFIRGPSTFVTSGQVYVKMLPSGEPVQLTHDDLEKMSPAFSPDGSRIAYTARPWDTWVVPVLGGEPRLWLPNASGLLWIGKSKLLFSEIKDKALHMGLVTAEESRAGERDLYLPVHERGMAHRSYPSPDGKSILVVEMIESGGFGPCRLVSVDTKSQAKQMGPPGGACTFAGWSPDGAWMYFSSDASGVFHIWRQRFPDGQPEQITSGPTEEEGIAIAPDGRSLLTAVGARQSSVWVHDSRGERQISLEGQASNPIFTPDGQKLIYRSRIGNSSELWIADLDSNHTEPLLPGFPIAVPVQGSFWSPGYDISPDGRQLVFFSPDRDGKFRLWLTPLDRRSPPRQVPNIEGEKPVFGPSGEIFFRKVEGSSAFLYSVQEDGGGLRRAAESPVADVIGADPNRKWLLADLAGEGEALFPIAGGAPVLTHLYPPHDWLTWSGDGKHVFLCGINEIRPRSYVLPLPPGQVLPTGIPLSKDWASEAELAKLPGVRIIPVGAAVPGPTADIYAFTRQSVQRNLYRIPLP